MILTPNQIVSFDLKLKVLRAFSFGEEETVYYLVEIIQTNTPIQHMEGLVWGVLRIDSSSNNIPQEVFERAKHIVENMKKSE
jgi:hypothetical protein